MSDNELTELTPEDVRQMHPERADEVVDDPSTAPSDFLRLFHPPTRLRVIDVLMGASGPLTISEMEEKSEVSRSSFDRNKDEMLAFGLIREAGMRGNAQAYELNDDHPVVQLLQMIETVNGYGKTPDLLDDQFIGSPGEERGE